METAIPLVPGAPGTRSRWSQMSWWDKACWLCFIPVRAVICFVNVLLFFLAYMLALAPVYLLLYKAVPRLYWGYEGLLYRGLQAFIAYWGYTANYDVVEYGDDIEPLSGGDRVLVICNHQSTADVPVLFAALQGKGVASRKTIWLMDVMFRRTPFGIVSTLHGDYFIQQGKATRDTEIDRLKTHMRKVFWERDRRWVILFPEGGFFYKRKESSQRYARENGFPHVEHCTLPRTGAAKAILEELGPRPEGEQPTDQEQPQDGGFLDWMLEFFCELRDKRSVRQGKPPVQYLLDATIAYPSAQPLSVFTLMLGTREECQIAVHYNLIPIGEVPYHDETKLRDYMYDLYKKKDDRLDHYYKTGEFEVTDEKLRGRRVIFPWQWIFGRYCMWLGIIIFEALFYWWTVYVLWKLVPLITILAFALSIFFLLW